MSRVRTDVRSGRRRIAVALLCTGALALSACSELPRSGPVSSASPLPPAPQAADFVAGGPRRGAAPQEIVQGFTQALSAGYSAEGFEVAREFLTEDAAATWDPDAVVRVSAEGTSPRVSTTDDGAIRLTTDLSATVDRDGNYTETPPDTVEEMTFSVARTPAGEWRIADLEDGVLLSPYVFGTVFSAQPLYFLTEDRSALVPDLRWLPRNVLATRVVEELLEGPTSELRDVAATELPEALSLVTEGVDVAADGIATVALTPEFAALPEPQRSLAGAQLERTLFGVATVREIALTSGGDQVEFDPEVGALTSYPVSASLDPLALRDGGVVRLEGQEVVPRVSAERVAGRDPRALAQSYDGTRAVVLDGDTQLRSVDMTTGATGVLLDGEGLSPPSVDRYGWTWAGDAQGRLWAVAPGGATRIVAAPWLDGRRVTSVAVSREGSRIVVASTDEAAEGGDTATPEATPSPSAEGNADEATPETGSTIHVAGVERGTDGEPVSLGREHRVGVGLDGVVDLAWVEDTMVAALGRAGREGGQPVVHLVTIGGTTRTLPLVDGAETMTASRGSKSLLVGTEDGSVWVRNGASWRADITSDVLAPAYPG